MWLVGYVYNYNGMGSWCIEAAHALVEAGQPATLVCAPEVALPADLPFPVLRIASRGHAQSLWGRVSEEAHRLSTRGPRVMREALAHAETTGEPVHAILLNSTEFFDPGIDRPQLVTAWARGVGLESYLQRLRTHLHGMSLHSVRMTLDAVGWWRRDWHAFRHADLVLAVSDALAHELRERGIRAATLHPCIGVRACVPSPRQIGTPARLLIVAESLDLPRKRVAWMLAALRAIDPAAATLTLVGSASERIRDAVRETGLSARVIDRVPRDDVQRLMREHHVFLFGSILDDWGYVLAEAMGCGMAVVAPAESPFDEIVGDAGLLYRADSSEAFRAAVTEAMDSVPQLQPRACARSRERFSREAFMRRLATLVAAHDLHRALPGGTAAQHHP